MFHEQTEQITDCDKRILPLINEKYRKTRRETFKQKREIDVSRQFLKRR